MCPAFLCVFIFFQDENACAFAHDKSGPSEIKRKGCCQRILGEAECLHRGETCCCQRVDGCFCAACDHGVCIAVTDHAHCLTDRIGSGCTSGDGRKRCAFALIAHCDHAACHVGDHHWNEEWGDFPRSFFEQLLMLIHEGLDAADAGADVDADAVFIHRADDAALFHGLCGSCHRELGVDITVQDIHLFHVCARIEISYFGCHLDFIVGGVKLCDRSDPAAALFNVFPERLHIISERADDAHSCYNNSIHRFLLKLVVFQSSGNARSADPEVLPSSSRIIREVSFQFYRGARSRMLPFRGFLPRSPRR